MIPLTVKISEELHNHIIYPGVGIMPCYTFSTYRFECLVAQFAHITAFLVNQEFNFDEFQGSPFFWASGTVLSFSNVTLKVAVGAFKDMVTGYNDFFDVVAAICKDNCKTAACFM